MKKEKKMKKEKLVVGLFLGVIIVALVTSTVGSVSAAGCGHLEQEFYDKCGEIRSNAAKENCERHSGYSGCALDVVGCRLSPWTCYNQYWCDKPGYEGCIKQHVSEYTSCLERCNSEFCARGPEEYWQALGRLKDCGKNCYNSFEEGTIQCKNQACSAYCIAQGSTGGKWVKYRGDACECEEVWEEEVWEEEDGDEASKGLRVTASPPDESCKKECKKIFGGRKNVEITEIGGIYPNCRCVADYRDELGRLTKTEIIEGDKKTIWTFNPCTGELIRRETISLLEERKKIMKKLGYKYTEEQIDKMLDDKEITTWFNDLMKDIKTETRWWHLQFWYQHILAIFDHGFSGNSADFVDTYQFGRCGDSMLWLENRLAEKLDLPVDATVRQQAMLSITGETGIADHTALLIRPAGITNSDWKEIVQTITAKSGEEGLSKDDIKQLEPKLLNARVLDPYFKKSRTLEEFIKKWPTIRIS